MSDRAKFNTWHYNIDDTINSINNNISNLAIKETTDIANVNSDIANVRKEHAADVSNINNDIANINTELDEVVHFNDPTSLIVLDKLEGAIEKSSADAGTAYEKNGSSISTSGAKNSDIITIDATSTIINQHNAANTTFTSTGIVFTDSAKKTHTVMYDDTTKAITDAINNIVATETTNRTAAVNAANDNLNAEEKARLAATNAVNTALDTEAKTRLAATNAVNSALDTEAKARAAATSAINAAIDAESKARLAATNAVNSTINTVNANVNAANDARVAATNAINTALDTEVKARTAATNAINTALDAESKARLAATNAINTALDTESKARSAATDAINSTINAVNANLDSANNARLAATNAINTALDTESKARLAATNAINSSFDSAKVVRYTVDPAGQANLKFLADDTINDALLTLADERSSSLLEILPKSAGLYSEAVTDTDTDSLGIFTYQTINKSGSLTHSEVAMEEDWTSDSSEGNARIGIQDSVIGISTTEAIDTNLFANAITADTVSINLIASNTESSKTTTGKIANRGNAITLNVSNDLANKSAHIYATTGHKSDTGSGTYSPGVYTYFRDDTAVQCTDTVKKEYSAVNNTCTSYGFENRAYFGVSTKNSQWPTQIALSGLFNQYKVSETATDYGGSPVPFKDALSCRLDICQSGIGYGEDSSGASLVFDCNDLLHGAHYDYNTGLVRYDKYITDGADSLNIGPYATSKNATYYPIDFGDGSIHVEGSASTDSYTGWYIDATNGKFATNSSSWIQVNANTIMYIPVDYYSGVSGTITIKSYSDVSARLFEDSSATITSSGVSINFVEGQLTKLNGKYYIKLTYLGNNYLGTTTVAYTANDYKVKLNADGVTTSKLTADWATINSLQASTISAIPSSDDDEYEGTILLSGGRSLSKVIIKADGDTSYSGDRGALYIDTNMARLYATKEFTLSNSYNSSYESPVDPTIKISYDNATPMLNIKGKNNTRSGDDYEIYAGPSRGTVYNYSSITAVASGELYLGGDGKNTTRTDYAHGGMTLGLRHSLRNYTNNISVDIFANSANYIRVGDDYIGTKAAKGYIFETDKGYGKYDHETWTFTLANGKTVTRTVLTSTDFTKI